MTGFIVSSDVAGSTYSEISSTAGEADKKVEKSNEISSKDINAEISNIVTKAVEDYALGRNRFNDTQTDYSKLVKIIKPQLSEQPLPIILRINKSYVDNVDKFLGNQAMIQNLNDQVYEPMVTAVVEELSALSKDSVKNLEKSLETNTLDAQFAQTLKRIITETLN